ncbi:uncharacterized protein VTP21DRAFT_2979 [Calcarisporiella thermophila]|uniref:uncharacterized protein n=1 Tax=Calcarisporiella thermophila TaxID=911321 RepID=UPI0037439B13
MKRISNKTRASVIQLAKEGKSTRQIGKALSIHYSTSAKIIREEAERRPELKRLRQNSGRPRILDERDERKIAILMRSGQCQSATAVKRYFKEEYNREVSLSVVKRAMQREEERAEAQAKKPRKPVRRTKTSFRPRKPSEIRGE